MYSRTFGCGGESRNDRPLTGEDLDGPRRHDRETAIIRTLSDTLEGRKRSQGRHMVF